MRLIYFASLRERIGKSAEEVDAPESVRTLAERIAWLSARDEAYAATFSQAIVRAAIDRKHAKPDESIVDAQEIVLSADDWRLGKRRGARDQNQTIGASSG